MHLIEKAIATALAAHRGSVDRYGRPYILHPLHLMAQMETDAEIMAAALHDVVEDSEVSLDDLRAQGFPPEVIKAVGLLTHDKENVPYEEYVQQLKPNAVARKVKLADLRHNMDLRRMAQVTEKDVERLQQYRRAWEILTATAE